MEANNVDFSQIRSFKDLRKASHPNLKENDNDILKLKHKADKAFGDGKFMKAYELYNQLLLLNPKEYDIIACLIGTALNLGYLDEVFSRTDFLIELDDKKAQGYYLKGIAYDILFNFEPAIELFLKALDFERDHAKLIVKNLTKTIAKYLNLSELFQFEDNDEDAEIPNLLRLLEATDLLIKKRKPKIANKVLSYFDTMDIKNFQLKTEFLIVSGNLFKSEQNYDKALIAFEECLYLADLNEDHKLKIKSLVLISSCYLLKSDLHRVIYFYHKILDIESDLIFNSSNKYTDLNLLQFNDEIINLELRIAIRQNLFTAHYRLGKLRLCCYYLKEMTDIIDNQLNLNANDINSGNLLELFDYIQIKIDASIELCKFYVLFKEFIELENYVNKMLQFIENLVIKSNLENSLDEKPFSNLKYFKIKCYSLMGIALAGLREFRYSKLCTKKSLALIGKESEVSRISNYRSSANTERTIKSEITFESSTRDFTTNEPKYLTLIKVELLMNASDATNQIIKTFKHMRNIDFSIIDDFKQNIDEFDDKELQMVLQCYEQRTEYAKEAYLQSKSLIDPNLRVQATFNLAISLYDNQMYQSAAYYFNECLSISTILIKNTQDENNEFNYLTDIRPDYHLESAVYLAKCQLVLNYYKTESIIILNDNFDHPVNKDKEQPIVTIYNKLIKSNEVISSRIIKWKLNETNRTSFNFNHPDLGALKPDKESERLITILHICTDCLIYSCYKMEKYNECLFYSEHNKYLLNLNSNDLIDLMPNKLGTQNDFKTALIAMNNSYLFYKFIFDAKLLYIIHVDQSGEITFKTEIKLSLIYNINQLKVDSINKKLKNCELDYFNRKFELIQYEWIKNNLNYYENRDVPNNAELELKQLRSSSREKEKKFYSNLNKPVERKENKVSSEMSQPIEFRELDLYRELVENNLEKLKDLNKKQMTTLGTPMLHFSDQQLEAEFESISKSLLDYLFIKPIEDLINNLKNGSNYLLINISIDSVYSKLLVYILNQTNQSNEFKIVYNIILDSFLFTSNPTLIAIQKEQEKNKELVANRKKIIDTPNRTKTIEKGNNLTNSIKVAKSSISPRNTSNPKLAHLMLNEDPDKKYILIRNDHQQKAKNRLDSAVGTLISNTFSQSDAKRSYLEIIEFKQVHNMDKCTVIGCPEVPKAYYTSLNKIDKFLLNGLEQLSQVAQLVYVKPIFSTKMTKKEVIKQFEISTVIFLSTYSTNESESDLICSETPEYPNSLFELDKYCKISTNDLNCIKMYQCKLLILNCYSIVHHRARVQLAKKFLSIGCQNVLMVLTPMPDHLTTRFYFAFLENLKKEQLVSIAYTDALLSMISILDSNIVKHLINASFCLLSSKHLSLSINEIAKSMVQSNIDDILDDKLLNEQPKISILAPNFKPLIEKTLNDLQILFKLLLNQLINDSLAYNSFKDNDNSKNIFYYLYDLVSKALSYIKNDKVVPEQLSDLIETNTNAKNILFCLGFNCIQSTSSRIRDQSDKLFISAPDKRYLDLNIRAVHILSALIETCFEKSIDNRSSISEKSENSINHELRIEASYINQFYDKKVSNNDEKIEIKIKTIIFNLQALLPINDKNLLTALIDIIALTKFSSEIVLSLSDQSIFYALNYYEKNFTSNSDYINLIDKDIFTWSNQYTGTRDPIKNVTLNHSIKLSINNKVANFLFAIGFEIVGTWLRFIDIEFNRRIIDLMLKFFTSFALDRDMTLYKELNINVLGQRSAVTKNRYSSMFRTPTTLTNDNLNKQEDHFKLLISKPWANYIETNKEMSFKLDFIEKFENLCERLSIQRTEALRHYLDYSMRQHEINQREDTELDEVHTLKVKFKPGGNPSKDRVIVNERFKLTYDQVEEIRKYFHTFLQRNLEKIFIEQNEKSQKLLLPLIKTKSSSVRYH